MTQKKSKRYPYQDTTNQKRSGVAVKVHGDGRTYTPPADLPANMRAQPEEPAATKMGESLNQPQTEMSAVPMSKQESNTPANDMIKGKSGKMYTKGRVEDAIVNQEMADQDATNAGKMSRDKLHSRGARRSKLRTQIDSKYKAN